MAPDEAEEDQAGNSDRNSADAVDPAALLPSGGNISSAPATFDPTLPGVRTIKLRFVGLDHGTVCSNRQGQLGGDWGFLNVSFGVASEVRKSEQNGLPFYELPARSLIVLA